ncbi:MAG: PAS domain S-box protein [Deltaproteobacteria bacterium]|nr:PAS domain S-box protein [Deltaproteobacteria bacterium]
MKISLNFKNTLILDLVLVSILPLALIGIITLHVLTGYLEKEITRKNFLLAKSLSGEIGAFINEPKDILRQLAIMIEGGALRDNDLFNASMESVISNYPVFEMIEVLDQKGRVKAVAPFRKDYLGLNMSGETFFKETQKTMDIYWSTAFISQYTGEPSLTVSLPLRRGILVGLLNLRVLGNFIDRLKQGPVEIGVVDRNGTHIASSVRSDVYQRVNARTAEGIRQALTGIEGTYRVRRKGEETLLSVTLVPETQWPVVVSEGIDKAFAPIEKVRNIFWVGIGLAIILALIVALIRVKRTLRPLSQLISDAKRIAEGIYVFKAQPRSYPEIDELTEDFRIMAKAMASREASLRESEKTIRALLDVVPDMIFRFNKEGIYTFMKSPTAFPSPVTEGAVGKSMVDFMPEEIVSERLRLVSTALKTQDVVRHEYPLEINGKNCYREALYVLFGEDEFLAIVRDITGRRVAEEALRESEAKYRTILENMEEGYYEVDLAGNLTFFNEAFTRIVRMPRDQLTGMNNRQFMNRATEQKTFRAFNEVYQTGKPARNIEVETIRKDGSIRYVEISAYLNKDGAGNPVGFRGIVRDVTDRKLAEEEKQKLESQLQQAQKMESLGTLAGGIAHDFNNLLMGIQGRASLMLMDKETSHPDVEHLKGIEAYVKNAAALTKQLLGFARGGKYEVKPTDVNDLIHENATLFGRTKKEITIHSKFQEQVWPVDADRGQIDQVLMNLYVNAWQAMPGGGALYLETENVTLDEKAVRPFLIEPGKYVKISVTDTGIGMDNETLARIFDPFFTTKEKGRGTGLGLASAYGIIKNHGGFIEAFSEEGEGTTFNIYLPASESEVVREEAYHDHVHKGAGTILLVDDEEMILDVGRQLLEKLGYRVLTARGGKEALEIYRENKDRIDMVILDMIMPDMTGGDTYDGLKAINPRVRTVLSSGYSINEQATEILNRGCNGFIQKPFNLEALSWKLREILGAP